MTTRKGSRTVGAGTISPGAESSAPHSQTLSKANAVTDPHRKKILLSGHTGAGKTACKEVAFHGLGAKETFSLEPTRTVTKENLDIVIPIQVWDCPGNYAIENLPILLPEFSTVIYVIDIQDDYAYPIHMLTKLLAQIYTETVNRAKPMNIEIFVHKADGMSDDYRLEYFRHLQERILESCIAHDGPLEDLSLTYHLTSCYDYTIHEAWSRVIQKLIDSLSALENLINVLCSNSGLTKAFLFDMKTLIHVSADESPPDATMYGLCCEYVQTIMQLSNLYKAVKWEPPDNVAPFRPLQHDAYLTSMSPPLSPSLSSTSRSSSNPNRRLSPLAIGASTSTPGASSSSATSPVTSKSSASRGTSTRSTRPTAPLSPVSPVSPTTPTVTSSSQKLPRHQGAASSTSTSQPTPPPSSSSSTKPLRGPRQSRPPPASGPGTPGESRSGPTPARAASTSGRTTVSSAASIEASTVFSLEGEDKAKVWATSCVRLKPQTTLGYWEITDELSLLALVRSETWEANQSLIDYNVTYFRKAIKRIVDLEYSKWKPIELANPPAPDTVYQPPSRTRPSYF